MQLFQVGGCVRDRVMGIEHPNDIDHVVIDETPESMITLGFTRVGVDFPVFLHPDTKEEYALPRGDSLEDDLQRRDLTMNAMAMSSSGKIIDPCQGQRDIENKILRHTSDAFADDPIRVLRLARFAARFPDFTIAPETCTFIQDMVDLGMLDDLVPERVWKEISRSLMETNPRRFFEVLRDTGALKVVLPEFHALIGVEQPLEYHPEGDVWNHVMLCLGVAVRSGYDLSVRWSALVHDLGKALTDPAEWPKHYGHDKAGVPLAKALCERLKIPSRIQRDAVITTKYHHRVHDALKLRSVKIVDLIDYLCGYSPSKTFDYVLQACQCDAQGRLGFENVTYPEMDYLRQCLDATKDIRLDHDVISDAILHGKAHKLGESLRRLRANAIGAIDSNSNTYLIDEKNCEGSFAQDQSM